MKRYLDYQMQFKGDYAKVRAVRDAECAEVFAALLTDGARAISGFPDYLVTNTGEIYSRANRRIKKLRPGVKPGGYEFVGLSASRGKPIYKMVHRLVAEAFLPNPRNRKTVNHRDGKKRNNHVHNLEWATYSENAQHGVDTGLIPRGIQRKDAKLTADQVREIRKSRGRYRDIGKQYGVCAQAVCNVKNGRTYRDVA